MGVKSSMIVAYRGAEICISSGDEPGEERFRFAC
jgi:hypothetical protein